MSILQREAKGKDVLHRVPNVALAAAYIPAPATAGTGGTIAAGVYTVAVSYTNALGETTASATATVTTTGTTSTITIPSPPFQPVAGNPPTGWYAYVSQAGGNTLTRQQAAGSPTALGTNLTLTAPPTATGAAPPASSTAGQVGAPGTNTPIVHGLTDVVGRPLQPTLCIPVARDAQGANIAVGGVSFDATNIYLTNPSTATAGTVDLYVA